MNFKIFKIEHCYALLTQSNTSGNPNTTGRALDREWAGIYYSPNSARNQPSGCENLSESI